MTSTQGDRWAALCPGSVSGSGNHRGPLQAGFWGPRGGSPKRPWAGDFILSLLECVCRLRGEPSLKGVCFPCPSPPACVSKINRGLFCSEDAPQLTNHSPPHEPGWPRIQPAQPCTLTLGPSLSPRLPGAPSCTVTQGLVVSLLPPPPASPSPCSACCGAEDTWRGAGAPCPGRRVVGGAAHVPPSASFLAAASSPGP